MAGKTVALMAVCSASMRADTMAAGKVEMMVEWMDLRWAAKMGCWKVAPMAASTAAKMAAKMAALTASRLAAATAASMVDARVVCLVDY